MLKLKFQLVPCSPIGEWLFLYVMCKLSYLPVVGLASNVTVLLHAGAYISVFQISTNVRTVHDFIFSQSLKPWLLVRNNGYWKCLDWWAFGGQYLPSNWEWDYFDRPNWYFCEPDGPWEPQCWERQVFHRPGCFSSLRTRELPLADTILRGRPSISSTEEIMYGEFLLQYPYCAFDKTSSHFHRWDVTILEIDCSSVPIINWTHALDIRAYANKFSMIYPIVSWFFNWCQCKASDIIRNN